MNVTDHDLAQAVQEYYAAIYRFALGLAKSEAEACDLTQETFYLLATRGSQLRDPAKLKSWLFTTCYRQFLGQRRRRVRFPHVEISAVAGELSSPAPQVDRQVDGAAVMEAVQTLDPAQREPLLLFYLSQLSYKEIAEVLGVPIGTVMSRLARAKAQLRSILDPPAAAQDATASGAEEPDSGPAPVPKPA